MTWGQLVLALIAFVGGFAFAFGLGHGAGVQSERGRWQFKLGLALMTSQEREEWCDVLAEIVREDKDE